MKKKNRQAKENNIGIDQSMDNIFGYLFNTTQSLKTITRDFQNKIIMDRVFSV